MAETCATPNIAIPDNNATGVTSVVPVAVAWAVQSVEVDVHITHTYRGDLIVELQHGRSFPAFVLARSEAHRRALLQQPLSPQAAARLERQAAESLREQADVEAADDVPFEQFRRQYLAQDLMGGEHFRAVC